MYRQILLNIVFSLCGLQALVLPVRPAIDSLCATLNQALVGEFGESESSPESEAESDDDLLSAAVILPLDDSVHYSAVSRSYPTALHLSLSQLRLRGPPTVI